MINLTFQLFAKARDLCDGKPSITISIDPSCVSDLMMINILTQVLPQQYSCLSQDFLSTVQIAYNKKYINKNEHIVKNGDVYLIIPPISGG